MKIFSKLRKFKLYNVVNFETETNSLFQKHY